MKKELTLKLDDRRVGELTARQVAPRGMMSLAPFQGLAPLQELLDTRTGIWRNARMESSIFARSEVDRRSRTLARRTFHRRRLLVVLLSRL